MRQLRGEKPLGVMALVLFVALIFPAGNVPVFSGLPLTGALELVGLLLVLPLASRRVREAVAAHAPSQALVVGAALLAITIAAKLGLLATGAHTGWAACFHPIDAPQIASGCERSYANPLFLSSATRFDSKLDFHAGDSRLPSKSLTLSNWKLGFANSLRWNRTDPADYRERLPFAVVWSKQASVTFGATPSIAYVGEGSVAIGSWSRRLPASYDRERTVLLRGAPSSGRAVITFRFHPPPGTASTRPYATLKVAGVVPQGPTSAETVLSWLVDVPLLVLLAALALAYRRVLGRPQWPWIAAGVAVLVLVPPIGTGQTPLRATLALVIVAGALAYDPTRRGLYSAIFLTVLVNVVRVANNYVDWSTVAYRTAGNDYLNYESTARSILDTGSLRGGEDVFNTQPGFRYLLFLLRLVFGDGDPLLAVAARTLLTVGILLALWIVLRRAALLPAGRVLCFGVAVIAIVMLNADAGLTQEVDASISEWPIWAGIPVGSVLLIFARERWELIAGTLLLAICVFTRTEYALALTLVLAVGLARWVGRDRPWVIRCAAVYVLVLLLPLAHNLAYGDRAVLFTVSSNPNVRLKPSSLPDAFSDSGVRRKLERQVRGVLYSGPDATSTSLWVSLHLLQLTWLIAFLASLIRWRTTSRTTKVLLLAPVLALGPFLFYDVLNYYPRHIIAGHLLIATVAMVAVGLEPDRFVVPDWLARRVAAAGPAVGSRLGRLRGA